jgi:hypothetical protein
MPFAGTLPHYQKQGMMHRLVNAVEQVAVNLNIQRSPVSSICCGV